MARPKKNKEETEAVETQTKDEKFRRIARPRIKRIIYELGRLEKMPSQPTYDVLDVDAQKLIEALNKSVGSVTLLYGKLAKGESIKATKKDEIEDIF